VKDKTLHAIYLLFVVMGGLIVGIAVFAVRAINRDAESGAWVNQTHATIYELDGMLSELQAGEGMMRTFALTGDVRDFTDCRSSYFAVLEHHALAVALTRDNPGLQSNLADLEATVRSRIVLAASIKDLLEAGRGEQVKTTLRRDAGTAAVFGFQQTINRIRNRQFELLSERDRESVQRGHATRFVVGLGVITNLLLFCAVAWLIRDTLATRRVLTETLQGANALLEQKVEERTREIAAINRGLKRENMERTWTTLSQERQLRYNHAIVNTVSDLVFVVSKALNVTRLNPVVAHSTGFAEEEILGRPITRILRLDAKESSPPAADRLQSAVAEGRELQSYPAELIDRGGKARPGVISVVPLRDHDLVVGAVVVLRLLSPL
jgi:PAS domain S-box-containing protein